MNFNSIGTPGIKTVRSEALNFCGGLWTLEKGQEEPETENRKTHKNMKLIYNDKKKFIQGRS